MPKVHFLNEYLTVDVPEGASLRDMADDNGVQVIRGMWPNWNCGGHGICGRCKVWLPAEAEVSPLTLLERFNPIAQVKGEQRMSCQVEVQGDVEVRTRPLGPAFEDLKGAAGDLADASYKEAAAEKLVEAKADEEKKEELAAKKKEAAAKKKAEAAAAAKKEEAEAKKAEEEAAAKKAEEAKADEPEAKADEPEAKADEPAKPATQKKALEDEEAGWDIDEESLKPPA